MLYETIKSNIKDAMKEKNTTLKDVLKQVQAKAQADAKEHKTDITDEIVLNAINKELKQLNQTLEEVKSKPESELFKSTMEKIVILKAYLPEQLSEEDIAKEIQKIISENPDVAGGRLTGLVMKSLKGKADNQTIKKVLDSITK
jgi:hypothetical protein